MSGYTCCMDQHTAHNTQHSAHTHTAEVGWLAATTMPELSVAHSLLTSTQPSVHTHTAEVPLFDQFDQSDEAVQWWRQHYLQAGDAAGEVPTADHSADAVAHTFRVQQSLSAGELSPEVLASYVHRSPNC